MKILAGIAGLVLASSLAVAQTTLKVGDAAPPLRVAKWVKGTPVKAFDKNKVYVVEFWATWCGPCRTTIPHLTEMAKEFKGKVTFAGISVWERPPDEAKITKFVTDMGDKMAYNIGMDDTRGIMAKSWMTAAGQNGIPASFVVGKTGKIEWIGHPMDGLDNVLKQVVAGTFDAKAAAAEREERENQEAIRTAMLKPAQEAYAAKDWKGVVTALDGAFSIDPKMEADLSGVKFRCLAAYDVPGAVAYGDKILAGKLDDPSRQGAYLAMAMLDNEEVKSPDYAWGIKTGEKAAAGMKPDDQMYVSLAQSLAKAYDATGNTAKAVEWQTAAVASVEKQGDQVPEQYKKSVTDKLTEYKAKVK